MDEQEGSSRRRGPATHMFNACAKVNEFDDRSIAECNHAVVGVTQAEVAAMDAAVEAMNTKHPEEGVWPLTFALDGTCLLLRDREEASFSLHPAEEAQLLRELLRRHIERGQRASAAKRAL